MHSGARRCIPGVSADLLKFIKLFISLRRRIFRHDTVHTASHPWYNNFHRYTCDDTRSRAIWGSIRPNFRTEGGNRSKSSTTGTHNFGSTDRFFSYKFEKRNEARNRCEERLLIHRNTIIEEFVNFHYKPFGRSVK